MYKQKLDCFLRIRNKTFKIYSLLALFIVIGRAHHLYIPPKTALVKFIPLKNKCDALHDLVLF